MNETALLARRAIREVWRLPAATLPGKYPEPHIGPLPLLKV